MKKSIFLIVIITFLYSGRILSQEIKAEVNVNMEQISEDKRVNVSAMQNDVERYLNNQKFTDIKWEGDPIPIDVTIVLSGGYNNKYAAQLFIASKRAVYGTQGGTSVTLKLIDKEWEFEYGMGANLSYNPMRFNEFSSLLDYYMLLIIGFELDTYKELDGTRVYDAAKQIVQMGASAGATGFKTITKVGDYTKYNLVSELTDPRFEEFRKLIYGYYMDGLDLISEDRELALETIAYLIQEMANFKDKKLTNHSVLLQAFFEAKYVELAELFKGYKKFPSVFRNLKYLDPMNSTVYEEAERGK